MYQTVLHQLDQKIIYPHYDFKHLTEKYFEIGMKLDDFLIQLVKYCNNLVVVANESYEEFVSTLQKEFEEDGGIVFGHLPLDAFIGIYYSKADEELEIGKEESEVIWNHLKTEGIIAVSYTHLRAHE